MNTDTCPAETVDDAIKRIYNDEEELLKEQEVNILKTRAFDSKNWLLVIVHPGTCSNATLRTMSGATVQKHNGI